MENYNELIEQHIPVPSEFEDVFSHFYFAENNTGELLTKTLLPSYQTIMVFNFGANAWLVSKQKTKISIDKCVVLGPIKYAFDYSLPVDSKILVANFKADGFYRFFGTASLFDHLPVQPDELIDENCFTNLWHRLNGMGSVTERISCILEFCRPYLRSRNATSELLTNFNNSSLDPIKTVAQKTQQTERNIQLTHKKYLGYSAKEMNRYQRFLSAIKLIQNNTSGSTKTDWFEVIEQCGYYDQSQLIHDFRHFINLSPKKFLKFQQDICRPAAE